MLNTDKILKPLTKDDYELISDCLVELITRRREAGININHVQAVLKIFHNAGIMQNQDILDAVRETINEYLQIDMCQVGKNMINDLLKCTEFYNNLKPREAIMPDMSYEKYVIDMYKSLNIPQKESTK